MVRRKRRLTPEESELWQTVARSMKRLGPVKTEAAPAEAPPPPPASFFKHPPRHRPIQVGSTAEPARPKVVPATDLAPNLQQASPSPRIDRRRYERLIRGKLEPEARLDLHGMTRNAAHAALISFVLGAQARGLRLVLVITGKGRPDRSDAIIPERTGILRHSLPHWLAAPPLRGQVLEIRSAHQRHGGVGAVYLYLKRRG